MASVLLLPVYLAAWLTVLDHLLDINTEQRMWIAGLLALLYVAGIVLMKLGASKEDKRRRAGRLVRNYLLGRGRTAISFQRIRDITHESSWTDDFLRQVIDLFPRELRLARIKGGKLGIGLIIEQEEA